MASSKDLGSKAITRGPFRWVFLAGTIVLAVFCIAILRGGKRAPAWKGPTAVVQRGPLTINVAESGTIHPREQTILRNDLERDAKITFIVEEGKQVKQGDLLVELDVTDLEQSLVERRIRVQTAESSLIYAEENLKVVENQGLADIEQADLTLKFARQDQQKYIDGEFPRLVKAAEAKITLARQELSRAEEMHRWSKTLFEEKYLSRSELQRDELNANRARLDLELAQADLELLQDYTYTRQMEQLHSDVKQAEMALERARRKHAATMAQAEAELRAKRALYEDEKVELKDDEDEIGRAKKYAPIDGMVLYASSVEDWDEDEDPIRHGTVVNEQQEIIYLPTTAAFNADVKILEVNLRKIAIGLPARVTVDAIAGKVLFGRVAEIAPVPDSDNWFTNPNLKVYRTVITLDSSDPALRNGMSCRVEIVVQTHADAVSVPIQAVTRVNRQPTAYVVENGVLVPRSIEIGLDNNRLVHVLDGLDAGEVICLAPPLATGASERSEAESEEQTHEPNGTAEGRS